MELETNKVYCGDSLEYLKSLEDNAVDLVVTDPPYGIGETNEQNQTRGCKADTTNYGHYEWDSDRVSKEFIDQIRRVSKNQIIFGGNYYTDYLPPSSCWIVWDKKNGKTDFADCEMAWASFDKAVRQIRWKWQGMLQEHADFRKEERVHPTQKPVGVMREILKMYASKDDVVLDPFLGSGSTAIACTQFGCNYIGIDKKEDYVEIAKERLKEHETQKRLHNIY